MGNSGPRGQLRTSYVHLGSCDDYSTQQQQLVDIKNCKIEDLENESDTSNDEFSSYSTQTITKTM